MGSGDRVVLGRVLGAFGIQGWIRVKPFTESFEGLAEQSTWTLSRTGLERDVVVEEWKPHGASLLAKVKGIDDRDDAEAVRGADVTVSRENLPQADEGEYYWSDLIGLAVRNERGVTRDIQIEAIEWWGKSFEVVDTGGLSEDREGFTPLIRQQVTEFAVIYFYAVV